MIFFFDLHSKWYDLIIYIVRPLRAFVDKKGNLINDLNILILNLYL